MRISDWSSDVCSFDLCRDAGADALGATPGALGAITPPPTGARTIAHPHAMFTLGSVCSAALRLVRHCAAEAIDPRPARAPVQRGDRHAFRHLVPAAAGIAGHLPAHHPRRTGGTADRMDHRSEEHTAELQALMRITYHVVCL